MKSSSWLKSLSNRLTGRAARRPIRHPIRLRLESLEDRTVPSGSSAPAAAYGQLPLAFEANHGQTAPQVDFLARGNDYMLSLTAGAAVLQLQQGTAQDVLRIEMVGAAAAPAAVGQDQLVSRSNYLIGSDPSQWHTNIANYAKVTYQNVYPGIDLVYYGNQRQLEYDFVVAPGVDPGAIKLSIQGARSIALDAVGNLVLRTSGPDLVQHAPVLYQTVGGVRQSVAGEFVLEGNTGVGFRIGSYDTSRPLVIDPVLSYSTYLGGSGTDRAEAIAVDADGNAYITGYTYSANFPTTAGVAQPAFGGTSDVVVSKLNASGTALLYSTYLGGTWDDQGSGIAVDAAGNAYVTGTTGSGNFPVSADAFQRTNPAGWYKGFVTKLNNTGSALVYSTYLGGSSGIDQAQDIAVDGDGNAYVTGTTFSSDFPTMNAVQPVHADGYAGYYDAFVTKLNAAGTALVYSTFLGGFGDNQGNGIAVDSAGNAYVTGWTVIYDPSYEFPPFPTTPGSFQPTNPSPSGGNVAFVTKFNAAGSALAYSTFLGGTTGYDYASAIAVDHAGNAYVTGSTHADDFPTTPSAAQRTRSGSYDAFVTALNPSGSALVYSTFLGGNNSDHGIGIAVDAAGNASVTGLTQSGNFPTVNALQPVIGGSYDAFVTRLNAEGSAFVISTYLGGSGGDSGNGIALDAAGNAYIAGNTSSTNFPTTPGAFQQARGGSDDAFVAKLDMTVPPPPSSTLSINDVSVTEGNSGTRVATFTVTRSGDTTAGVSVGYSTANGTATASSDYLANSGTLTFAPGETSRTITVTVNGDRLPEGGVLPEPKEVFFVNLGQPTTGAVTDGQGVGTILDDEPRISINDVTLTEGHSGTTLFTFTVTLSAAYDQAVTMSYRTADGTAKKNNNDYVSKTGTLTFAPGETTKTITIVVKGDTKKESNETFYLDLFDNSTNSLFAKYRGIGTILNDD